MSKAKCTAKVVKVQPPYCAYSAVCLTNKTPPTHTVECDYGNGSGMRTTPMCETCARKCARHLRKFWKEHGK